MNKRGATLSSFVCLKVKHLISRRALNGGAAVPQLAPLRRPRLIRAKHGGGNVEVLHTSGSRRQLGGSESNCKVLGFRHQYVLTDVFTGGSAVKS